MILRNGVLESKRPQLLKKQAHRLVLGEILYRVLLVGRGEQACQLWYLFPTAFWEQLSLQLASQPVSRLA